MLVMIGLACSVCAEELKTYDVFDSKKVIYYTIIEQQTHIYDVFDKINSSQARYKFSELGFTEKYVTNQDITQIDFRVYITDTKVSKKYTLYGTSCDSLVYFQDKDCKFIVKGYISELQSIFWAWGGTRGYKNRINVQEERVDRLQKVISESVFFNDVSIDK